MPFTPAHPAIAMPFLRRAAVDPVALVVGCMVPDFEYFLRVRLESQLSHTALGLLLFDVPVGLVVVVIVRRLVAAQLLRAVPLGVARRVAGAFKDAQPPSLAATTLCVALGAASHIGWDAFTHQQSALMAVLPWLSTTISLPTGGMVPVFKVLQHGSTLLGALIIVVTVWRWPQVDVDHQPSGWVRGVYGVALFVTVPLTVAARAWAEHGIRTAPGHLVVAACSGRLLALLVGSLLARRIRDP